MTSAVDPLAAHHFALELDGIEVAWFSACTGLGARHEVFEVEEGGVNDRVHRLVGPSTPQPIVLRAPLSTSQALFGWRQACDRLEEGAQVSGAVTVYDAQGDAVQRYEIERVWPVSWEGPTLDASGSEVAVEALTLAHEGIYRKTDSPGRNRGTSTSPYSR